MSSPRTLAFLSRLPAALDEPEQRWAARTISADDEIAFCAAAGRRFQATTPEREALTARLRKVADEARTARDADPAAIAAEVAELVRPWREEEIDNLRDVLEDCANLWFAPRSSSLKRDCERPSMSASSFCVHRLPWRRTRTASAMVPRLCSRDFE